MNNLERQRIVDQSLAGGWQRIAQVLPGLNIQDGHGPELVPQWLEAAPVRLQPRAQMLLRAISNLLWRVDLGERGTLVLSCAAGRWRLVLRQVPEPGLAEIEPLPAA